MFDVVTSEQSSSMGSLLILMYRLRLMIHPSDHWSVPMHWSIRKNPHGRMGSTTVAYDLTYNIKDGTYGRHVQ